MIIEGLAYPWTLPIAANDPFILDILCSFHRAFALLLLLLKHLSAFTHAVLHFTLPVRLQSTAKQNTTQ